MSRVKSFIKQYFVLVILLFLIILFGILSPDSFLTMSNMFTIVRQSSIMGIATIGLLFVMVAGGIDLSLSSVISLQSVIIVPIFSFLTADKNSFRVRTTAILLCVIFL